MRGKTREIQRLFSEGMSRAEIARQVKCSPANVSITLKRHGHWDKAVRGMPLEYESWLTERARTMRVNPGDMAARLLMEIIDMYKCGDY